MERARDGISAGVIPGVIPADADLRRRLWREWIHADAPVGDRPRVERRRTTARPPAGASAPTPDWLAEAIDRPAGLVTGLAAAVRESLVGAELPATDRERIVRRAAQLGVNRFEASLIIAAVQHRARGEGRTVLRTAILPAARTWGVGKLVACVVCVEAVLGAAGFWWLTR